MSTNTIKGTGSQLGYISAGSRCTLCNGFGTIVDLGKCCAVALLVREDADRVNAKLQLNALYGRFAVAAGKL